MRLGFTKPLFAAAALLFSLLAGDASAVSSEQTRQDHTSAQLHTAYDAVDGKSPFYVLFHLSIDDHWHTYWTNPGDSGLPTRIEWTLPEGWKASEIEWLPPHRLPLGPLMNYGYEHDAYHLVKITPAAGASGDVELKAKADWLVCKEECIPETATLSVTLPVVDAAQPSDRHTQITELQAKTVLSEVAATHRKDADGKITLSLPFSALNVPSVQSAYFYVDEAGTIEPAAEQFNEMNLSGTFDLVLTPAFVALFEPMTGIVEVTDGDGVTTHRRVVSKLTEAPAAAPKFTQNLAKPQETTPAPETVEDSAPLLLTLLFALLGGFILNAMPCVFPVLSLKALGLSRKSSKERQHIRAHGLAYTLGVVGSFAVVGLVLIALKLSGDAVGWGYQMQSPYFIVFLTYLLFLIGLNLSGYFDIRFSMNVSTRTDGDDTLKGSFATGALVTLVATPCSAPFMATALGAALSQPPAIGMAIFVVMGLGLALPYLLLTTVPGALKWMPKPGLWMERFKQFLAFPMYISAVWLLWVFMLQAGATATALLLLGLVLLAFALWIWRAVSPQTFTGKAIVLILLAAMTTAPLALFPSSIMQPAAVEQQEGTLSYDPAKLESLRAEKKPVFVYATAAWCITCKVNERVALNDQSVKDFLVAEGITTMVADWTSEDATITAFLEQYGRAGVPLYVFFPADGSAPRILPQLLTPATVIENLKGEA